MSKDLYEENKELYLKIDGLVGNKNYPTLIKLGEDLINDNAHPSLLMSYYVYRYSWPIPEDLKNKIKGILDNIKE